MRRTRSNSNADNGSDGRRSLRSAHIEELCEIPSNLRNTNRASRTVSEQNIIEKSPPTRRSSRLSGEELDLKEIIRSRKRRMQIFPCDATTNDVRKSKLDLKDENEIKACKILRKDEDESDMTLTSQTSLHNGVDGRTRQKVDFTEEKSEQLNNFTDKLLRSSSSTPPREFSQLTKLQNATGTPRRTRFSPRSLRSSPGEHNSNCVSSISTQDSIKENCENTKYTNGDSTDFDKDNNMQKSNITKCHCENHSSSNTDSETNNISCKLCGKSRKFWMKRNGSISNGEDVSPSNLQSTGQATTVSSFSTIKNAGSPIAAEEAFCRDEAKSSVDDDLSSLRRSRRKSERDVQQESEDESSSTSHTKDERTESEKNENNESIQSSNEEVVVPVDKNENRKKLELHNDIAKLISSKDNFQNNSNENNVTDTQSDHGIQNYKRSGSPSVFDEMSCADFDFISDNESDYSSYNRKKRKMNLRSSGVRCDPDFYTLSLDLMIKRPHRRSNLLSDFGPIAIAEKEKNAEEVKAMVEIDDSDTAEEVKDMEIEKNNLNKPNDDVGNNFRKEIESLFTVKSDHSQTNKIRENITCTGNESPRSLSPCSSSTPQRFPVSIHKTSIRGRGRGPKGLVSAKLERSPNLKMVVTDPTEPPPIFNEEPPSGPDVYFFESDHVALKHNKDYHNLLHTVSMLESQRYQCLSDIKTLECKKTEVMEEPVAFVEKLQKQVDFKFPSQQTVPELPDMDWSKYASVYGTFDHVFSKKVLLSPKKPFTRKKKINFQTGVPTQSKNESLDSKNKFKATQIARSETFGIAWTVEEQRKLEELLLKHPSEETESNRYRKIAADLGSRSALQVQSRVQKYFIKLAKAGFPIPGNMPRLEKFVAASSSRIKRSRSHPHQQLTKMSTFFPTFHVPVRMDNDDNNMINEDIDNEGWTINNDQISDEEDVSEEMRFSDEYLEILRLKRLRRERLGLFDQNGQQAIAQHVGYECDMCDSDPIEGVRYHCIDCPAEEGVDLCQSCIRWQGQFEKGAHTTSHRMEPVYKAEHFVDDDYLKFVSRTGEYNYLDPNFFPPKS